MLQADNLIQILQKYSWGTVFLILFLIGLLYCYLTGSKESRKRLLLLIGLSILIIFNDIALNIIKKFDSATYYRFLWGIPIILLSAYVILKLTEERKNRGERAVIFVVIAIMIWNSSTFLGQGSLTLPENRYSISDDVIQVCDIIGQDKEQERPVVIFDLKTQLAARTYDASLVWGISREAYLDYEDSGSDADISECQDEEILIRAVNYGYQDGSAILSKALAEENIDYIVTKTEFEMDSYFAKAGYELVGKSETRSVYGKSRNSVEELPYNVSGEYVTIPGMKGEYRFVIINDMHIIVENEEIPGDKLETVKARYDLFADAQGKHSSELWLEMAEQIESYHPDAVLLAGDMLDYMSTGNIACLKDGLEKIGVPVMYVRADQDVEPWYSSLAKEEINEFETSIDSNEDVFSMEFNDFIIVGINNSTSQMSVTAVNEAE